MGKYETDLLAAFAAQPPKAKERYNAAVKKVMKRDVTPDLLPTIISVMAKHGKRRKWKSDSCFKKAFIPPFTAGSEKVYQDLAARLVVFDELFERK